MLTVISLSSKTNKLKEDFSNYKDFESLLDLKNCTHYTLPQEGELSIYSNRSLLYSCCYTEYKNKKFVTKIYSKKGILYNYELNYDD